LDKASDQLKNEVEHLFSHADEARLSVKELATLMQKAHSFSHAHQAAEFLASLVKPELDKLRAEVDKLELLVDDANWKLPKYRELLFIR
jgi:glutamine synthetase